MTTPVTIQGSHGHDVPITIDGGIAHAIASHYESAIKSIYDHGVSVQFSFADTISAGGHGFVAHMGATIFGGGIQAAEGNATLLGSGSAAEFGDLFNKAATVAHSLQVDTIFGGAASPVTASDFGSAAASLLSIFSRPVGETIGGSAHSVSGGAVISLGHNATINFVEPHHVPSITIKLG